MNTKREATESISIYRRFRADRKCKHLVVTEGEISEYYTYIKGRNTMHGDEEYVPDNNPLTIYGVKLLKQNGEPWTHGEATAIS